MSDQVENLAAPKMARPSNASCGSAVHTDGPAASGSTEHAAIAEEEDERCSRVVAHLRSHRPSQPPERHNDDQVLIELRDQIAESHLEDVPALLAQMQQVSAVASQRSRPAPVAIDPSSPYFGHLRLKEEDRGVRDVLIGKATFIDPRSGIRIVDWRHAPVSQLYYRYAEGSPYEETFGDREVEGEVVTRRTLTIIDGKLHRVSAPQGVFTRHKDGWRHTAMTSTELSGGEGTAVRADHLRGVLGGGAGLDQRADRHLPEIAALLDPRQFDLISKPDSGLVVIQGGAGSGKTTIGVHRMAYLAYQRKQRFTADRMLVVVGTPALRDYIGQLLGALDLGRVPVVTFTDWARRARQRAFFWLRAPIEENTPIEVSRLKTSPAVLHLLDKRGKIMRQQGRTRLSDAIALWADVLTDRDALAKALATEPPERQLNKEQLERAWKWCSDRCPAVADLDDDQQAQEPPEDDVEDGLEAPEAEDERATLDDEDDALLLRAHQLVHGPLRHRKKALSYEHLFVDEAQDLSATDLCVLANIVNAQKSITLAGDTSQRINLDTGFASWNEVLGGLGLSHVEIEPLRIAYRSTREVLRFARHVLGPLADPEAPIATRSGAPVEYYEHPTQGAAAAFLAEALRPLFQREPRATVCILARYPEQAEAYYEVLKVAEVPYLRHVQNYRFEFRPGIDVTEIRQVKGLEYDYVILVDVNRESYPADDEARFQLHIGATRAAHQLWIVATGSPSPLLPEWLIKEA